MKRKEPFAYVLRDRIAQDLRDRILSGSMAVGTRLDLDRLATEYGSSRTPVREALIELSHDGLVDVVPRRGVTVRGFTTDEVLDTFKVFGALSGVATQWTTEHRTPELIHTFGALIQRNADAARRGDTEEQIESNYLLHREIHRACGSVRLLSLIRQLNRTMPFGYLRVLPEHSGTSIVEHHELLDAIASGDGVAARQITEQHFHKAGERLVQHLAERGQVIQETDDGEPIPTQGD